MNDRGFTLVELLVAALVTLAVFGIALAIVGPARAAFDRDAAGSDLAQRLRIGLQSLGHDIRGAGAGAAVAEHLRLPDSVPIVQPLPNLDTSEPPDGRFHALRVVTIPAGAGQARLREPVTFGAGPLRFNGPPFCPGAAPACGFVPGEAAIVFDETTTHDIVEVGAVDAVDMSLTAASPLAGRYAQGAVVAAVDSVTFGLAPDDTGGTRLVKVSHAGVTMPLIDHIVEFVVEVYGAALPPRPGARLETPPTYGPRPPPLAEDDGRDSWGAGENCTMAIDGNGVRVARLPELGVPGQLVRITPDMLADGPWCPGSGGGLDFDADLFRIRRVDVRVRVEAASEMLRGPAGPLFRRAGVGNRSAAWVPDGEFRLSIVPRNLRQP